MAITEEELIAKAQRYDPKTVVKGLNENEIPIPISPTLRPIELKKVDLDKEYKWCSCGMSDK
jgi:hypothetical protein